MSWSLWAERETEQLRRAHRWRTTQAFDAQGPHGSFQGRQVISFCSNDYLGLTQHPAVCAAARSAIERFGSGAGASRFVCGTRSLHLELETQLAAWRQTERATLFPTGYAANLGVLSVFGGADTLILSDELNHASIVDGCRLAKGRTVIYRHRDLAHVAQLLSAHRGRSLVVSDAVFSMDGSVAPLEGLLALCEQHDALLVLDEAHAVLGPHIDAPPPRLLRVGTLSKTLAAVGGWVAGSRQLIELLVNRARTLIFTTATAPADTAAALAALQIYRAAEGAELRERLRRAVAWLAPGHPSPIVPIILGSERAALQAAEHMLARGLLVPAIRPPTVAEGSARLRVALSAAHTPAMLEQLQRALQELEATMSNDTAWMPLGAARS